MTNPPRRVGSIDRPSVILSSIGKFHIWSLAKELHKHNSLGRFYTGYPRWKLGGSDIPAEAIRTRSLINASALGVGRLTSSLSATNPLGKIQRAVVEAAKSDFERFVARDTPRCDVFHGMSQYSLRPGVAARERYGALFVLDVGSSHVLALKEFLQVEFERVGVTRAFFPDATVEQELEEYQQADVITVPSKFAAQTFIGKGISPDRIEINVLGVDLSRFFVERVEPPETFTITFVGALSVRKGLHVLAEAFRIAAIPSAELVLIGTQQAETRTILNRYPGQNIRVVGRLPQTALRSRFSRSSVFVLPSVEDGFGMVILEALACGCPVIASDHTGGPDVIADGDNGIIVPSGNAEALAQALVRLYRDKELLRHMRIRAAQQANNSFGWNAYGENVVDMYRRRLSGKT